MDLKKILRLAAEFVLSVLDAADAGRPSREDIERARALMKIADLHLMRFNKSREIEWQVNIFTWAAVGLVGAFFLQGSLSQVPLCAVLTCLGAGFGLVTLLHAVWLVRIQYSQNLDKCAYLKCRDRALELVRDKEFVGSVPEKEFRTQRGVFWIIAASAVTLLLSLSVLFLIHAKMQLAGETCASGATLIREAAAAAPPAAGEYTPDIYPLKLSASETLLGSGAFDLGDEV